MYTYVNSTVKVQFTIGYLDNNDRSCPEDDNFTTYPPVSLEYSMDPSSNTPCWIPRWNTSNITGS